MLPDVMQVVTGKTFRQEPATLSGYVRYRIKTQIFPAIIASAQGAVDGILYYDIDDQSLHRLDEFESHIYQRRQIRVQLTGADNTDADAYIIDQDYQLLLSDDEWDPDDFKRVHLQAYLSAL